MSETKCIFCGKTATTKEHIPAKHLFKGKPDKDLITVPSCEECNKGFQKDEEFFRQFWATYFIDRSPHAKNLSENEISRSITRTPALGQKMFSQMQPVDKYTENRYISRKSDSY